MKRTKPKPAEKGRLELDEKIVQEVARRIIREWREKSFTADPVPYIRDGIRLYLELLQP